MGEIGKGLRGFEVGGQAVGFETGFGEGLEGTGSDFGAVGGEENGALWGEELEGQVEEVGEVVLRPETASFVAAGEGGGIENDGVECFVSAEEAGEQFEDVFGEKSVRVGGDLVELEIGAGAIEGFFGEIDGEGLGAGESAANGEGAGVGEGVEEACAGALS